MLSTAVIVFVSTWQVPARIVDQNIHQGAATRVIVPDSLTDIRFERRCRPRMSPNGRIVIRVIAMIPHRPHNVRFFPLLTRFLPNSPLS
jgi:hypothetical protein